MLASLSADLLVVLHFVFIVFVVLGGFLVLKWRKVAMLHIPCALWGTFIEFSGMICPLTPLEHRLREAAGETAYNGRFIDHYIVPLVYPTELTRGTQISLGIIVLVINLCFYGMVLLKYRRKE